MEHNLTLYDAPFKLIKSGLKTIEMRLNDDKRKRIKVNDTIVFENIISKEKISVVVTSKKSFKSFEDLYAYYPKEKLGYSPNEEANPKDMLIYYKNENILRFGTVAIQIELIK